MALGLLALAMYISCCLCIIFRVGYAKADSSGIWALVYAYSNFAYHGLIDGLIVFSKCACFLRFLFHFSTENSQLREALTKYFESKGTVKF